MKTILLAMILLQAVLLSQDEKPCSAPEALQFDFWLGDWIAEWDAGDGAIGNGTNTITKIMGGCTLQENFSTSDKTFMGTSFSVYSPKRKLWLQTWVDNMGGYLDFTGGKEGDKMILSRKGKDNNGNDIMQRMMFYNITKDNFDWNWETSKDDGKTWELKWKIKYKRKT